MVPSNPEIYKNVTDGGIGRLVNAPMNAFLEVFWGGSPINKITGETKSAISNILWSPFQVAANIGIGAGKLAAKTAISAVAHAPILPVETQKLIADTRGRLGGLSLDVINSRLSAGKGPLESFGFA